MSKELGKEVYEPTRVVYELYADCMEVLLRAAVSIYRPHTELPHELMDLLKEFSKHYPITLHPTVTMVQEQTAKLAKLRRECKENLRIEITVGTVGFASLLVHRFFAWLYKYVIDLEQQVEQIEQK